MAGVPHRSLGRSVRESYFRNCDQWKSVADIPNDAIDEFIDYDDPETSLWTDDVDGLNRADVMLALAFARPSIGKFSLAMLWQNDNAVGDDLGNRIVQSDGDTPYLAARHLHYHVSNPRPSDYGKLALAAANRGEISTLSVEDFRILIEDAYLTGNIPGDGLRPKLQKEIDDLIQRRFIKPGELWTDSRTPIFDIRPRARVSRKIDRAEFVSPDEFERVLHDRRIGSKDTFVIYCDDGNQCIPVARQLRQAGKTLRVLVGGIGEWVRLEYATSCTSENPK